MNDILTIVEHQEILVANTRNVQKKTISYEDRELLFDIVHYDRQNKKKYVVSPFGRNKIKANSIVGSISLKTGLTIEILPKFSKQSLDTESVKKHRKMLLNMLRVSKEKNFISSSSKSSKISANEMPLLHYIVELFSSELLLIIRSGAFRTYNQKIENSSHIKGKVLISKTINNNSIDRSKVFIAYNKYSSNNLLMQIFRTLAKILLDDTNLSYATKQTLHEIYRLLDGIDIIALKPQDFKTIVFNRLNDKYETIFRQAEFIFNRYMPFSSHINSTPFWSILFNMDYLFEKFCAYLFKKSGLDIEEQTTTKCFNNHKSTLIAKPDFIIKGNKNLFEKEIINVVDAKWKLLSNDKNLYGLDSQNFWQLFSYMNLLNPKEELHGYFIVPKNNENFDDEIIFTPIKEGNKSITILSIDFSLSFEELIERYRFEIINKTLQIKILEPQENVEIQILPIKFYPKEIKTNLDISNDIPKLNLKNDYSSHSILSNPPKSQYTQSNLSLITYESINLKDKKGKKYIESFIKNNEFKIQLEKNKDIEVKSTIINDIDMEEIKTTELQDIIIEKHIIFDSKELEKYYTNDYTTLISLANIKNLPDEYKIILFYREYDNIQNKSEIQQILKSNSSKNLVTLFETSIHDFVLALDKNFEKISQTFQSFIRGFTYCSNNHALFKIKIIIAKNSIDKNLIEKLSCEKEERKIIFALLSNYNKDETNQYIVSHDILEEIFINSIEQDDYDIAIAILKRKELDYSLFKEIIEYYQNKINLNKIKNNIYINKYIANFLENLISNDEKKKIEEDATRQEIRRLEQIKKVNARRQEAIEVKATRKEAKRQEIIKEEKIEREKAKRKAELEKGIVVIIEGLWYQSQLFTQKYTWEEAKQYAKKLRLRGHNDWRLPTTNELMKLGNIELYRYDNHDNWEKWFENNKHKRIKNSKANEYFINKEFVENMPSYFAFFWTTTEYNNNSSCAWGVNFNNGYENWCYKSDEIYVLCVRG